MKHAIRTAAAFALASLCFSASAGAEIVTFQIPHAYVTYAAGLNDKGDVTGFYDAGHGGFDGFIWRPGGKVVSFDVPGAEETEPAAINATGVVTGSYFVGRVPMGFVRAADGTITTFRAPDGRATGGAAVNRKDWIVGYYLDNRDAPLQPLFRDPSGAITEFTVPGATSANAVAINRSRRIAGMSDIGAFVRAKNGAITVFGNRYTTVAGINDAGTVAGVGYSDGGGGYLRTRDGTTTTFSFPAGATGAHALGINNSATVVGYFDDSSKVRHGFIRTADGTFTPFDPAGSTRTEILAINNNGAIMGNYADQNGVSYLFEGTP